MAGNNASQRPEGAGHEYGSGVRLLDQRHVVLSIQLGVAAGAGLRGRISRRLVLKGSTTPLVAAVC
jgi:hypothetical protein